METKNFYEHLGVSQNATTEEIRTQWRKLIRQVHPDMVKKQMPNATEEQLERAREAANNFSQLVNEAYETLRKPDSRERYDAQLRNQKQAIPQSEPKRKTNPQSQYTRQNDTSTQSSGNGRNFSEADRKHRKDFGRRTYKSGDETKSSKTNNESANPKKDWRNINCWIAQNEANPFLAYVARNAEKDIQTAIAFLKGQEFRYKHISQKIDGTRFDTVVVFASRTDFTKALAAEALRQTAEHKKNQSNRYNRTGRTR